MRGKIGFEEHFAIDDTIMDSAGFLADQVWSELKSRLLDIQDRRLRLMDENGMEMMLLSLNAPAIQARPDALVAKELAKKANDFLAEEVAKKPERFQALAALPLQDPDMAIEELQRCVKQLGFKGALVNGFSQIGTAHSAVYYDLPQYRAFWAVVESLDVPFYLHPRNPLPEHSQIYEGHSWLLGPTWPSDKKPRFMPCALWAPVYSTRIHGLKSFLDTSARVSLTACGGSTIVMAG
jgi:predicted TIM-barrel fold metal-dependent hydrolase